MTTTAPPATLTGALTRFTFVPPDVARYVTDVATGARALSVPAEQITELAERGLPHLDDPDRGLLFDYDDLMNVGMASGTGRTIPELGLRFLLRFASGAAPSWYGTRDWTVKVQPVPRLDGRGDLPRISVLRPDFGAPGVQRLPQDGSGGAEEDLPETGYEVAVRLTGAQQTVTDPRIVPVWQEIVQSLVDHRITYQVVPETLRADPERAWSLGMADCIVAAKLLAARLRAVGVQARARRGWQIGVFGSDHAWCEVVEEDRVLSLDAVWAFVTTVGDKAKQVATSPEFAAACFGSRFNRLLPCESQDAAPLVSFDGSPAPYWAMTGVSTKPRSTP